MAIPTFTTDLTDISTAENTTDWFGIGALMSAAVSTDFFREGSASIGVEFKGSTGRRGACYDVGVGNEIDFTVANTYLYIWVWVASEVSVNTVAADGVRVYISSSAGGTDTNYNEYTIGGSDADWVGKGWKLCPTVPLPSWCLP